MKKLWLLPVLALFLAACGNEEEAKPKDDNEISVDTIEPEEDAAETDQAATEDSETALEKENTEDQSASTDSGLSQYEESAVLEDHLPMDELTSRVEADNPGKRIILFENQNGEKVYKSIFIKHDQHVKIIDLKEDNLLFEGRITK
ncbi:MULTISPECIES: hypothetical protein [unclassified Sporosarcina]|uniref:hypothetical protein n=1 Tax=unclassified Sporosarcina TaxID=2647733 RepID=UPI0020411505|nr:MULTISPECIES: hypothetical protein [unclassified Sporosarcina]GKV67115.1 hypothetical protein NCCP2331_32680 [Sporosarcina sp. NCCP-2331]GLB57410.1 hypothetical protein NCCP2378_31980 [Sporosarcina sp. NCCP-2378]